MKKTVVSLVSLAGAAALLLSGGCMNVAKKMQEADTAYKSGRFQESCDITAKVLKKEPKNVGAMVLNGLSLHQLRKDREAGAVLEQAAQAAPSDFAAQYFYGCLLADTEDYANALPPLRAAYRINPECEPLVVLLARCCVEQNLAEGVRYLQVLRKYPDMQSGPNAVALANNLGCLLINSGNYDRAAKAFAEAWGKDPQDLLPPQNLAVLYDQYVTPKNPRTALSYYRRCQQMAEQCGNTVKLEGYKARITALERENPRTPPAAQPHGTATTAGKHGTTAGKTTTSAGKATVTSGKTGTKGTSTKTGAKTTATTGKTTVKKPTTSH